MEYFRNPFWTEQEVLMYGFVHSYLKNCRVIVVSLYVNTTFTNYENRERFWICSTVRVLYGLCNLCVPNMDSMLKCYK